jgi:type I restriction enzyme S subunit
MELIKGYKQTEVGVIPSDWSLNSLGELGEVKMCRRIFNHETKPTGDIPFFKIGTFGKQPDAFITEDLYLDYKKRFSFPIK